MKPIGESISDAIDWAQDTFKTTRPIAEKTLFSLLNSRSVVETEEGYVLQEEDDAAKHFSDTKNNMSKNWSRRSRIKFHVKRKMIHMQNLKKKALRQQFKMDSSDSAEDMLNDSSDKDQ